MRKLKISNEFLLIVNPCFKEIQLTMLEWLESFEEDLKGDFVCVGALGVAHNYVDYVDKTHFVCKLLLF